MEKVDEMCWNRPNVPKLQRILSTFSHLSYPYYFLY